MGADISAERFDQLGPDQWQFNEKSQVVTGANSGKTIHLGQPMTVRIISVNISARQLNLAPVELLVKTSLQKKQPARSKKRKGKRR